MIIKKRKKEKQRKLVCEPWRMLQAEAVALVRRLRTRELVTARRRLGREREKNNRQWLVGRRVLFTFPTRARKKCAPFWLSQVYSFVNSYKCSQVLAVSCVLFLPSKLRFYGDHLCSCSVGIGFKPDVISPLALPFSLSPLLIISKLCTQMWALRSLPESNMSTRLASSFSSSLLVLFQSHHWFDPVKPPHRH